VAPQVDANAHFSGLVSSGSWTHTIGSNANAIFVFINPASASVTLTCKIGATSMTQIANTAACWAWVLYNPPTGSQTVSFTVSASTPVSAISVSLVNAGPIGTVATTTGTGLALSQSASPPMAKGTVLQSFGVTGGASTITAYNQTQIDYVVGVGSRNDPIIVGYGNGSFTATSGANFAWTGVAVSLAPI